MFSFHVGSIWSGTWTWIVQMTPAFDMCSNSSDSSDYDVLQDLCAKDLKLLPDQD